MSGLLFVGLIIAALAALDYAALRWGVDTRPGFGDSPERTDRIAIR